MVGLRPIEVILAEWRGAERELAEAPKEQWLAIMARIDQLQDEYRFAMADDRSEIEALSVRSLAFDIEAVERNVEDDGDSGPRLVGSVPAAGSGPEDAW